MEVEETDGVRCESLGFSGALVAAAPVIVGLALATETAVAAAAAAPRCWAEAAAAARRTEEGTEMPVLKKGSPLEAVDAFGTVAVGAAVAAVEPLSEADSAPAATLLFETDDRRRAPADMDKRRSLLRWWMERLARSLFDTEGLRSSGSGSCRDAFFSLSSIPSLEELELDREM